MICSSCGAESAGGKFCRKCGSPIAEEKAVERWLDGTPVEAAEKARAEEMKSFGPLPGYDKPKPRQPIPEAAEQEAKPKIEYKTVMPIFDPETSDYWGKISTLILDPETFFSKSRMEKEVGAATITLFLSVALGRVFFFLFALLAGRASLDDLAILISIPWQHAVFFAVVSLFGMILMTVIYSAFASWKRIYGIYCFSFIAYAIVGIPYIGWLLTLFAFLYFAYEGFQNEFGLGPFEAGFFAAVLPVLAILGISSAHYWLRI